MKRRSFLAIGAAAASVATFGLWRLNDHDLDRRRSESFDFAVTEHTVSGTLWLPDETSRAAIVLVHGDGPRDRTSDGGYAALINVLLDARIAVACWDKPGIGGSGGNWLHQSMGDRAAETRAALDRLDRRFDGIALGAVGFSQAGWVLPRLSSDDADFLVLIGPAISWQDQGEYYTGTRLALDGMDETAIARGLADRHGADERAFGAEAQPADRPEGMSRDRWTFIRENRHEDARAALARLDMPLLAVWGAQDLNVDAAGAAHIYRDLLSDRPAPTRIVLWPEATHSLLKSDAYNWQLAEQWSWMARLRFLAEGRHAFAPGALDAITEWIGARSPRDDALRAGD